MPADLIKQFVDERSRAALGGLINSESGADAEECGIRLSALFGPDEYFKRIIAPDSGEERRFVESFKNNIELLIQKTWIEETDIVLKEQVIYQVEHFRERMLAKDYFVCYGLFLSIVDSIVYLMFGEQAREADFSEYTFRLDPAFGIFWWYMKSLPQEHSADWVRVRIEILLGMFFLANY